MADFMTGNKLINKHNFRVREYLVPDARKVIFVFTAMGTKIGLYKPFVGPMNRNGYSCIVYDYPLRVVLDGNLEEWNAFYDDITTDAKLRLRALQSEGATHFSVCGISMGTLMASKLAREIPEVTHVILNLIYGDLARNIWTYKRVHKAKRSLKQQGIDEQKLRGHIRHIDPIATAAGLKGKKVLLFLSRSDKVLVYSQTLHTKYALEKAGVDLEYVENKYLGHYLGGIKNMLARGRIEQFLAK